MSPEQVIAGIESFAAARVVRKLAGGPASDSYLVERHADGHAEGKSERFVLRLDTRVAGALGLDRQAEADVLSFVSRHGLSPAPEFSDPGRGVLITRYVDGRAWTEKDLDDPDRIRNLAALVRRLHALEPHGRNLNIAEKIDGYARVIGTAEGRRLADDAKRLLRELEDPTAPRCLCHNDINSANVIEGVGLALIDWEYAAVGDPMLDLATIAEHHRFDRARCDVLLDAYVDAPHAQSRDRFIRYRTLYRHLLVLWLAAVEQLSGISAEQQAQLHQTLRRIDADD